MTRVIAAAGALVAAFLVASCGGGGGSTSVTPPQGPPSARHPASAVSAELTGEQMRAHLFVADRLYINAKFGFSAAHIATAKQEYNSLSPLVRPRDSVLDREFHAAFPVIDGQIAQRAPLLAVTNRMGMVQGQLLEAAIHDAMGNAAFNDPGVSALVMMRLAEQGAREYAHAAAVGGFTPQGKRAYQDAFGLITRASSLSHNISNALGPQRNAVVNGLNDAHSNGFPTGVLEPRKLHPLAVAAGVRRAQAAVSQRFGFAA